MGAEAVRLKDISGGPSEPEKTQTDEGRHYIAGNLDAMIVFNDAVSQCQRSLKVTRYIYADDKADELDRLADETQKALERQFLRHDLKRMLRERETQIKNMEHHVELVRELSRRKATRPHGKGLNQQELDMVANNDRTMAKAQELLDEMDAKIAEAKTSCGLVE